MKEPSKELKEIIFRETKDVLSREKIIRPVIPGSEADEDIVIFDVFGPIYTYSPEGDMEETFHTLRTAIKNNIDDVVRFIFTQEPELASKDPESTPFQCVAEEWLLLNDKVKIYSNPSSIAAIDYSKRVGIDTILFSSGTKRSMRFTIPLIFEQYNKIYDQKRVSYADLRAIVSLHGTGMTKKEDITWEWLLPNLNNLNEVNKRRGIRRVLAIFDDNIEHLRTGVRMMSSKNWGLRHCTGYHCQKVGSKMNCDRTAKPAVLQGYMSDLAWTYIRRIEHERVYERSNPIFDKKSGREFSRVFEECLMPLKVQISKNDLYTQH